MRRRRRRDDRRPGHAALRPLGLEPAAGLPAVRGRLPEANPNIKIEIQLNNWNDYWGGLARGFIAETAPDVFTDHLAKYPQFATSEVIEPLNRYAERDGIDAGSTSRAWRTCGRPRRAAATGSRRTGTRSPSSSTRRWSRTPAITKRAARHRDLEPAGRRHLRGDRRAPERRRATASAATSRASTRPTSKIYGLGLDPGGLAYGQTTWGGFAAQPRLRAAWTRTRGAPSTTTTTSASSRRSPGGGT